MSLLSNISIRIGFSTSRIPTNSVHFDESIHALVRYMNVLTLIGIDGGEIVTELLIKNKNDFDLKGYMASKKVHNSSFIIFFPVEGESGTQMTIKRWDIDRYCE